MSLATRTRFPELDTLRDRIDRLFTEFAAWPRTDVEKLAVPVDLQESDTEVTVTASLPGIKAEDIYVEIDHGMLTIRGESHEERDETQGDWHLQERRVGSVERMLTLPATVDTETAAATIKDGVLSVTLQKSGATPPKKVEVTPA